MARDRAEVIRRALDAYNRGNYDAASEYLHPDVVLVPPGGQAPYRGVERVRQWMEPDAFLTQDVEALEITEADSGLVLVHQRSRITGAQSGIEMQPEFWTVWTFDESGLVTQVENFLLHQADEAREAAGLAG